MSNKDYLMSTWHRKFERRLQIMWEHCFLNTTTIVVRYRKREQVHPNLHFMSISNSEGALEAVGVLGAFSSPPFSTVSVGASPLVQNKYSKREENRTGVSPSPKIVWEPHFCRSQPSGPE